MMGTRYVGAGVLASAVGMDKHYMKLVLSASGLPVGPFVTITPAEWASGPGRLPGRRRGVAPTRSSSSRPAAARASASPRSTTRPRSRRRSSSPSSYDPKVIVEQGFVGARELECGVLADPDGGRRWRARWRRSGSTPHPASTTSRPSTCRRSRSTSTCRRDDPAESPRRSATCRAHVRGDRLRGTGPGGRLRHPERRVVVNEINTMPGFTAALDVSADVGRQRSGLPGAGRPADHAGRNRPVGSALSRLLGRGRSASPNGRAGEADRACSTTAARSTRALASGA